MTNTIADTRVRLGRTELEVSPICYGSWQLSPRFWGDVPENEAADAMKRAFDLGINFFDTADAYGDGLSETVMGKALSGFPRSEIILATKVYWHWYEDGGRHPDLSRKHILEGCDASLSRLGMDYIDLYQLHAWDAIAPMNEIIEALETLKKQGKVRHYGVSNWNPEQMRLGHAMGGEFATCQPPYSLINRGIESDVLPYCQANDMGVLVYSPLYKGLLTGKYKGDEKFDDFRKNSSDFTGDRFKKLCDAVQKLDPIAKKYDMTILHLVLAVTLAHPGITCAIVGIKRAEQIEGAVGAIGKKIEVRDAHEVRTILSV